MFIHLWAVRRPLFLWAVSMTVCVAFAGQWLALPAYVLGIAFLVDTYARWNLSEKLEAHLRRTHGDPYEDFPGYDRPIAPGAHSKFIRSFGDPGAFDKRLSSSWCGRGVMTAHIPGYKQVYRERGYRWYHILPDDGLRSYTRLNFWKRAFGLDAFETKHNGELR